MWPDNETDRDFLNFEGIADTIAELIVRADGKPVSIGISGAWGSGKSSLIKLTQAALHKHQPQGSQAKYIFVNFNAWLYQGYDDARAALLEVIADRLQAEAEKRETAIDKARDFLSRVRWFRLAKLLALPTASVALGLPPIGVAGELAALFQAGVSGDWDSNDMERAQKTATTVANVGKTLLKPKKELSPPQEIQALRESFVAVLREIDATLVVLIDDLDRCLPDTTISTLEAIRLFLFMEKTAFVIAADDAMIKHAVKKHFGGLEDDTLVTNYFDKLVQIPIRVPALGTQEVRAYMMMLFIDNSELGTEAKDALRRAIAGQLRESWKGKRVDRAFIARQEIELPPTLVSQLETAERLAPLMTTADQITGNPRLIKRFLNALSIRMTISSAQGVGVDEAVLAKLLLFERLAPPGAYAALTSAVNADSEGKPRLLAPWEAAAAKGEPFETEGPWDSPFVREWLTLPPALADEDLRGALYVGREQAPLITAADRLSSEAATLLTALLENPTQARAAQKSLQEIQRAELSIIMDGLLARARQEQSWGAPPILDACIVVAEVDPAQGDALAGFLINRPPQQIQASIVPKIARLPWARPVMTKWMSDPAVENPVKRAIESQEKIGNFAK
ncbi:KAP family P-loop NTPase fold protein [Mycolicibacterium phlei]|uniref:KAP family P-loop NTPase fold protein n=1 Tax=Mycolicibacterium phlei TaxID=1771 RepID=UPI00025AE40E|nr:P-loop NTPase fold protein [Mycolicibacterium phlei]EID14493.1 ATPase [Mycolicibacterium phlei RIVM601174]MBF4195675.1 ATPase [Mycolicibacterium phlei]